MKINFKNHNNTLTMTKRCLLLSKRNPDTFLTSIMLPALMMLLFVIIFGNLIHIENISYVEFIVPGILLQCIAQGSSNTAIMINKDISSGIVARFGVLPIKKSVILNGHIIGAFLRNTISVIVVVLIAILLGFRPSINLLDLSIVLILLIVTILVLSWLAIVIGIVSNSAEGASGLIALTIILPYLSSGFAPVETLPNVIRIFAKYQPMTPIIDTMRTAFLGNPLDINAFIVAILWCMGLIMIFYFVSLRLLKKRLNK
jgi:ABC-type polysaccharide/polyol phosphate export systems, permease component